MLNNWNLDQNKIRKWPWVNWKIEIRRIEIIIRKELRVGDRIRSIKIERIELRLRIITIK